MDRVDTPITKPLPNFWSFFWKTFHDLGWTEWKFTIFLETPKTKKQEEDELVQREKKHLDPLIFKFHSSSFRLCFNNLKRYGNIIEALQTFLKCKDNRVMSKKLKLQNANWSYMPTHIPMTLFTWRMHILLKPSSIWTIFVALNAPSEALQNLWKK